MRRLLLSVWLPVAACHALASAVFPSGWETPAVVALVLDTSGSLSRRDLGRARELALGIFESLPEGSQVALLTFDDESRVLVERTDDAEKVRSALASLATAGRYTALHDALFDAGRYLEEVPSVRRAIILITDGKDENSALNLEDGLEVARANDIPVFTVGMGRRVRQQTLRRIAKLTDGRYAPWPQASSAALASWILETPAREASEPAPAAPSPSPPPAPRPRPAWLPILVWTAFGLGLVVTALVLALRAGVGRRCPSCHQRLVRPGASCPSCGYDLAGSGPRSDGDTIVARQEAGTVDRTVVLAAGVLLAFTRGPRAGEVFELPTSTATSLGRGPENDIVLSDTAVSGQHCRIQPDGDRFVLHDLQSTNGTFVNDRRVGRQVLAEGDVIRVGETSIELRRL